MMMMMMMRRRRRRRRRRMVSLSPFFLSLSLFLFLSFLRFLRLPLLRSLAVRSSSLPPFPRLSSSPSRSPLSSCPPLPCLSAALLSRNRQQRLKRRERKGSLHPKQRCIRYLSTGHRVGRA
eukprot:3210086-Rhodomonas_salina.1